MIKLNKTTAIIRARLGSERFPNKVLSLIGGKPALQILIDRVKKADIHDIILLTTCEPEDDRLYLFAVDNGIQCLRSDYNVLFKTYDTAISNKTDIIVDITADCPFIDNRIINELLEIQNIEDADYVSNIFPRHLPIGFDIQVYKTTALKQAIKKITKKNHYNHSGWNILNYCKDLFIINLPIEPFYNYSDWRVVLDYPEDLILLNKIYDHFQRYDMTQWEIIDFIKANPELLEINKNCKQKNPDEG
jgi:spore coat polysaccharide biosynthesis protein SpsF (cytidylyltransferase family)